MCSLKKPTPAFINKENKTKKKCYIEQGLGLVPVNIVIPLHPLRQKEFTRREATHQFRTSVLVLSWWPLSTGFKTGRAKGTEKKEEVEEVLRDEEEKQSLKLHHRVQS